MQFKLFETVLDMKRMLQNNQPRLVVAGDKQICVIRQDQKLIAFENQCPHLKEGLSNGVINGFNEIVCPLHGYMFHLQTGEENRQRCSPLRFYATDVLSDGVYITVKSD